MKAFKAASSLKEVQSFNDANSLAFLYIFRGNCSVCHAGKPRVKEMQEDFSMIASLQVSVNDVPEAAGEYMVFTVPALLLFIDGKEWFRKARFVVKNGLPEPFKPITEQYDGEG